MNKDTFIHDISRELANRAHSGTSFSPEKRGEAEINYYASTLAGDFENFSRDANHTGKAGPP
jgi:hypothetical protein